MTESGLKIAMRLGSISPSQVRDPKDLGRFGLGLKTASFSQCRKFIVASKHCDNPIVIRCWDIDHVIKTHDWRLLKLYYIDSDERFSCLTEHVSGTIVLWENIDVICKNTDVNNLNAENIFLTRVDDVKKHISMTFHRYLERHKINILINGRKVEPWDPFLRKEPATQLLSEESHIIFGNRIVINPYVLPHHSKITSEVYDYAQGPQGWTAQQGFYVYRNERLIVAGSWLGLGFRKLDHYQLARIQIDIPNSMDFEWEIDVKKSIARPPSYLKDDLKKIAKLTIERATEIYRHRGKVIERANPLKFTFLWEKRVLHGKIFYKINRQHPLVSCILNQDNGTSQLNVLLKMIEDTVPVNLIIIDNAETPDDQGKPFEKKPSNELKEAVIETYNELKKSGHTPIEARNQLIKTEPFDTYSDFVMGILDTYEGADNFV